MSEITAPETAGGPHTWEDFIALDDADRRELVDGELVEIEMPNYRHERIVARLIAYISNWADANDAGVVLASGYKVRIAKKRGAMPDVQFFRRGNLPPEHDQGLAGGHPDLAIEVMSPSSVRYDRVTKLGWYASIGVGQYWIVDPDHRTIEQLVLESGRYVIAQSLSGDCPFAPSGFDGLEIPLAKLWEG